MPADALAIWRASASAGMILTPKAGIFCLQHQKSWYRSFDCPQRIYNENSCYYKIILYVNCDILISAETFKDQDDFKTGEARFSLDEVWTNCVSYQCLVQDCSNSIADALELLQCCTKLSIFNCALFCFGYVMVLWFKWFIDLYFSGLFHWCTVTVK